ncbi:hypothetical protein KAR91_09065 [Candidatus Pacearchaeota archaeon]|nr:hypothetical protein [Candidatus Pacearchaeota archaeon]
MEYYAPKARVEVEEVEAVVWDMVKGRFSNSTERWADILTHSKTGKCGCVLPDDWRELGVDLAEVDIQTHEEMEAAGWFPVEDL